MEFKVGQRVEMIKSSYSAGTRGYVRDIGNINGLIEVIWDKPVVTRDMAGQLSEHKATMIRPDMIKVIDEGAEATKLPRVADFAAYRKVRPIVSVCDIIRHRLITMSWKERMEKRGKKHRGK